MTWALAAAALVAVNSSEEPRLRQTRIEDFKARIGFSKLAGPTGEAGVRAAWDDLPNIVSTTVNGLRLSGTQIIPLEPGLAESTWSWKRAPNELSIWVFVSSIGPTRVREKLISLASETTMVKIPYEPGPPGLGHLSVWHTAGRRQTIIWVFRNVCVRMSNAGSGVAVEPVARAIQRFMEANGVTRLADHVPRVGVDMSAKQLHVGDELRLALELPKGMSPDAVVTEFEQVGEPRLEALNIGPQTATYRAVQPGQARIDVQVVDRKTVLSSPLSVTVEVLPKR